MIPKKIHYCWFGRGEKPKLAQKCIASWKKYMPDYEIIEWNEDNFDVNYNAYTKMCYEQRKYAFLTDYLRLLIIEEHGGIYFDTDVEALRSFDVLLNAPAFVGFEDNNHIATGLGFGAEPHNSVIQQMLKEYEPLLDGQHGVIGCPILNTDALLKSGLELNGELQKLQKVVVYPAEFFNPMSSTTGVITITNQTFSIHRYAMSWLPRHRQIRSKITKQLHRFFGVDCFRFIKKQ